MKIMKKISLFLMLVVTLFTFTGCGTKNVEGTLEELMTKVYADIPEESRPMMLGNIVVDSENIEYYLGTNDIDYKEALASESGVGSIAHSVVLVRLNDGADTEKVMEAIKDKVDPRKWICVGVEKEDIIVKNKGNLVILIMVEDQETRTKLETAFDNL